GDRAAGRGAAGRGGHERQPGGKGVGDDGPGGRVGPVVSGREREDDRPPGLDGNDGCGLGGPASGCGRGAGPPPPSRGFGRGGWGRLLRGGGSGAREVTEAPLVGEWPAAPGAAWTVIVAVPVPPEASVERAQVTTAPAALQPVEPETNVSPAGSVSVIVGVSA